MKHTEREFLECVIKYLESRVSFQAQFWEIRNFIEKNYPLNEEDLRLIPSLGCPSWHQIIRNLKSNKSLLKEYSNINEIRGGFALTAWKAQKKGHKAPF